MRITVGVYIFNPDGLLLVTHPNEIKADVWGIPKGMPDSGEPHRAAGIREVTEETGIVLWPYVKDMEYVGTQKYLQKDKTLIAYTVTIGHVPAEDLYCESLFTSHRNGEQVPEIDKHMWVDFYSFFRKMQPEQVQLWNKHIEAY
jgi:8-oxo-dGTP pyrophosphatase MutT (NUDIX family)